jgi:uncharacterized protein (DUF488 family)
MLFTIGHSNRRMEDFVNLLKGFNINCVVDVRSMPYSKFAEQFNRENIKLALKKEGIKYIFMGEELGARRMESCLMTNGIVDFEKVIKDEKFLKGIQRVINGIKKGYKIVLMCTEKVPIDCHRAILVSRKFNDMGEKVVHIMADGKQKSHTEIEQDLIHKYFDNIYQINMFYNLKPEEYLIEAYKKANVEIGFREKEERNNNECLHNRIY